MKLLIDMNLSPEWVPLLGNAGWEAVHWSSIGRPNAAEKNEIYCDQILLSVSPAAGELWVMANETEHDGLSLMFTLEGEWK